MINLSFVSGFCVTASKKWFHVCMCALFTVLLPVQVTAHHDLAENFIPVTPYVDAVLERAEEALIEITTAPGGGNFTERERSIWLNAIEDAVSREVDTELTIGGHQRDLLEYTACMHMDVWLIQGKMHEVQEALLAAFEDQSHGQITVLDDLYRFLNDRQRNFINGARDPSYVDESWGLFYKFDTATTAFCCDDRTRSCSRGPVSRCRGTPYFTLSACYEHGCKVDDSKDPDRDRMCPFHTDVLPPTSFGYGCDIDVMEDYTTHQATKAEHDALEDLIDQRIEYFGTLKPILQNLGLTDAVETLEELEDGRDHKERFGCDGEEGDGRRDDEEWLEQIAASERKGPFHFVMLDHLKTLRRFSEAARGRRGNSRQQADYLKRPSEFEGADPSADDDEAKDILFGVREYFRTLFGGWNEQQSQLESQNFARFSEPRAFLEQSFGGLRQANMRLSSMASNLNGGLRGFVRDFAYFIRRSCYLRTCNDTLDRVLKIILEDSCFPYTSGQYLGGTNTTERCEDRSRIDINR